MKMHADVRPCLPMLSETSRKIHAILDDLESGGYKDFMNYVVVRQLLSLPPNPLTRLYDHVLARRPTMDLVNLVCVLNGAFNYVATEHMSVEESLSVFADVHSFDAFLSLHELQIREIALTRNNNPTIPQRAFPLSCYLPEDSTGTGLLDLGCSRGDTGLVLLHLPEVLSNSSCFFFHDFLSAESLAELKAAHSISRYFGVDLDIETDDAWLLSLWGLSDSRRAQLSNFYGRFRPVQSARFQRVRADICDPSVYSRAALDYFGLSSLRTLVIFTSFVMYQLHLEARVRLVKAISELQAAFLRAKADGSVYWFNQDGMEPGMLLTGSFDFAQCHFSRLSFEGETLVEVPLLKLANDACEGWSEVDSSPVVMGTFR